MAEAAISAQISIYPLRQQHLTPAVETVSAALKQYGLEIDVGPMSTRVTGAADAVFAALKEAFTRASIGGDVVMTVTISNACPLPESGR